MREGMWELAHLKKARTEVGWVVSRAGEVRMDWRMGGVRCGRYGLRRAVLGAFLVAVRMAVMVVMS